MQQEILHADVDSFHCQVYEQTRQYQLLKGKPYVVANRKGIITSVSEMAKPLRIEKTKASGLRALQVQAMHPGLEIIWIEDHLGKPDSRPAIRALLRIREAAKLFQKMHRGIILEFPLKDEFFMDVTHYLDTRNDDSPLPAWETFEHAAIYFEGKQRTSGEALLYYFAKLILNQDDPWTNDRDYRLLRAAILAHKLSEFIFTCTGFRISVGISVNKMLAKLATGLHKPNGITVLTPSGLNRLASVIKMEKICGLGGDTGRKLNEDYAFGTGDESMTILQLRYLVNQPSFKREYGKHNTTLLRNLAFGRSDEPVRQLTLNEKLSSGKKFGGRGRGLRNILNIFKYFDYLLQDLFEKLNFQCLDNEKRIARWISFRIAYQVPGSDRIRRKTVTVETGAVDIPLAQYEEIDLDSIANIVMEELQKKGVDLWNVVVRELRFFTKFQHDDFIDEMTQEEVLKFIISKDDTENFTFSD